jgi:aminoglycoside phosphotransferase family enzyme/gluconate kinase
MLDLESLAAAVREFEGLAPDARIEVVQTHISIVVLAPEHVFKLKKPVKLPFLDFSTPAARKHACDEEVRLNRRLCPAVYLGVVALHRDARGLTFHDRGAEIDSAVRMTRLPAERMLDRLLEHDAVGTTDIEDLARRVADFHKTAERGPAVVAAGDPRRLAELMRANFVETAACVGTVFDATLHTRMAARERVDSARLLPLLERRARAGRVVDGHGDLHARNVCMTEPPAIYDCIEFCAEFRCLDVATENAFMAMDLRYRGHRELAEAYVRAYVAATGDAEQLVLLPALIRYRALVRAKVAAIASSEPELSALDRERAAQSARRHLRLAAATALEQDGRTWIAACGPPAWARLPADAYSTEWTDRTYDALLSRASASPDAVVLLDATWGSRARRDSLRAVAARRGARTVFVHLDVPEAAVRQRLAARANDPAAISDADVGVYERFVKTFERPTADEADVWTFSGTPALDHTLDALFARL